MIPSFAGGPNARTALKKNIFNNHANDTVISKRHWSVSLTI